MGRKILEIRNNQSKFFVYDAWNVIEEYKDNDIQSSTISDEGIDKLIAISANSNNFWVYQDIIKSIIYIMKGEEKDQYYDYDEFGK